MDFVENPTSSTAPKRRLSAPIFAKAKMDILFDTPNKIAVRTGRLPRADHLRPKRKCRGAVLQEAFLQSPEMQMLKYPGAKKKLTSLKCRGRRMEVQSAIAFDTEELERLKASNLMKDFVRAQDGNWNHAEWENFVGTVRELGYSLPIDVIGAELEMEKSFYWKVKNGELMVPESQDSSQATPSACEAMVCERADELQKGTPYDVHGPRGPDMPTKRNEPFDPISELENAVIVEGKNAAAEVKGEPEENEPELSVGSGAWENVNFDSLTKEERAVYLKDQWKKKMGEG